MYDLASPLEVIRAGDTGLAGRARPEQHDLRLVVQALAVAITALIVWSFLRTNAPPAYVTAARPALSAAHVSVSPTAPSSSDADLCDAMQTAGAAAFAGGGLHIFHKLRDKAGAAAWVRQRRCSFRSYGVPRAQYRDLVAGLSAQGVVAPSRLGVDDAELSYRLADGRRLTVRWAGPGTDPANDIYELHAFAQRLLAQLERTPS